MAIEVHEIVPAGSISAIAFNKDRTKVALSPNSQEIHIFAKRPTGWVLEEKLIGHDQRVTGIDWAPESDRIVSCAQDRNAYVWVNVDGKWRPTVVLLRINRAATCVKWCLQETKFAVGTGSRVICICYFDKENDWWVCRQIKEGIQSTILCLDWHPNGTVLAAGSADFKTYVFSSTVKGVDKKPADIPWGSPEKVRTCGSALQTYNRPTEGWVHGVAFSPSGNRLAWTSHSSTVSFVDANADLDDVQTLKLRCLPLTHLLFTSESSVVAGGHDCEPIMFVDKHGRWAEGKKLDTTKDESKRTVGRFAAMDRFKQLDSMARTSEEDSELSTVHQNTISDMVIYASAANQVSRIATSGIDGRVVIWTV